jgi:hypothetical protein
MNTYRVVIKGAREDLVLESVIDRLVPLFNATADMLRPRLLSGNFTAKQAVDLRTAEEYCTFLEQRGCVCAIEADGAPPSLTLG